MNGAVFLTNLHRYNITLSVSSKRGFMYIINVRRLPGTKQIKSCMSNEVKVPICATLVEAGVLQKLKTMSRWSLGRTSGVPRSPRPLCLGCKSLLQHTIHVGPRWPKYNRDHLQLQDWIGVPWNLISSDFLDFQLSGYWVARFVWESNYYYTRDFGWKSRFFLVLRASTTKLLLKAVTDSIKMKIDLFIWDIQH